LPTFPPFGKRMLMDNGWYRMLRNPKVELVDAAIDHIEGNKLVTRDGVAHEGDVLLIATGFNVLQFLSTYDLVGRSGKNLRDVWGDEDASAYLGTVIPDFPNFFTLYGPNPATRTRREFYFRRRNAGALRDADDRRNGPQRPWRARVPSGCS